MYSCVRAFVMITTTSRRDFSELSTISNYDARRASYVCVCFIHLRDHARSSRSIRTRCVWTKAAMLHHPLNRSDGAADLGGQRGGRGREAASSAGEAASSAGDAASSAGDAASSAASSVDDAASTAVDARARGQRSDRVARGGDVRLVPDS